MVYGSTLLLPGDFFSAPTPMDPSSFVSKLRHTMQSQQFIPTGSHGSPKSYVPRDLHQASHVYVRRDGYRRPLTRPYTGPFQVLSRTNKHFTVVIDGQSKEISVDRLKPARLDIASYQETTQHNQLSQPPTPHHCCPSNLQLQTLDELFVNRLALLTMPLTGRGVLW